MSRGNPARGFCGLGQQSCPSGRNSLVDGSGQPVANARIQLRMRNRLAEGRFWGNTDFAFDGAKLLLTDANGLIHTPMTLQRSEEYSAMTTGRGLTRYQPVSR